MGKEGEVGRQIGELRLSDGPKFSLCSLESSPEKKGYLETLISIQT